jgi:hypothetical protein
MVKVRDAKIVAPGGNIGKEKQPGMPENRHKLIELAVTC